VKFTATDACGNQSSCTRTVTICGYGSAGDYCTTNAVLRVCGSGNGAQIAAWLASVSATDVCRRHGSVTNDYKGLTDTCGQTGSASVKFTATDACGNQSSCTRTVTMWIRLCR